MGVSNLQGNSLPRKKKHEKEHAYTISNAKPNNQRYFSRLKKNFNFLKITSFILSDLRKH